MPPIDTAPSEHIVFESRKFRVARRSVEIRDGTKRSVDIIHHPGAVVVLPLLGDDEIVMIRNFRHSLGRELWELPAGTLDRPGESPEDAAIRELEEETGYRAASVRVLSEFHPSPGVMDEQIIAFVATGLRKTEQRLEPTERIVVETLNANTAVAMARDGTITDAKTMVTLMLWDHERRNV